MTPAKMKNARSFRVALIAGLVVLATVAAVAFFRTADDFYDPSNGRSVRRSGQYHPVRTHPRVRRGESLARSLPVDRIEKRVHCCVRHRGGAGHEPAG